MSDDKSADIAQTAIFLWRGFMCVVGDTDYRTLGQEKLYDRHFDGLGQDGGAYSIALVAQVLEEEYPAWASYDFPGVYHYEITEVFGGWLAKEGPSLKEFQYGNPPNEIIKTKYREFMAGWLVEDKLTGH